MASVLQLLALIVAAALVQTATSVHLNDTIFAVTVSSQMIGGNQETLCAHINNPTEAVTLTVTVNMNSGNTTILEEENIKQDFYRCITFQVPIVSLRTVSTIHVTVQGKNDSMMKKTKVLIDPPSFIHIIQTDKPIYKPGQTIQFRIVSLDTTFLSVDRVYKVVELQDPRANRIAQWLDQSVAGGILDLSHPMNPEAEQGVYVITATTDKGEEISHSFEIKEYVLPKYEVKVYLPSVITILDKEIELKICGKYTYGKPVLGSVKVEFCRYNYGFRWPIGSDICNQYSLKTDKSGCATQSINMTAFSLDKNMLDDNFKVSAELKEDGTGVVLQGSGQSTFSNAIRTVSFEDVSEAYKPGIPFEGKVKMIGPDLKPVVSEPVYLFAYELQNITLMTDKNGMASFSLDTSLWKNSVSLKASAKMKDNDNLYLPNMRLPEYRSAYHHVSPFYSKSNSFLKLMQFDEVMACGKDAAVRAQYIIQGEELKKGEEVINLFYLVMSKGTIVQHGLIPVDVKVGTVNKGEVSVPLHHVIELAPVAQLVIYTIMPSSEAVADSQNFPVELCLKNKVSLKFSSLQELPAEKTTLNLQAHPGSLCSVRAIDQSVLLLQQEQELTVESVYNKLPLQKLSGYSYEVEDFEPYPCIFFRNPKILDNASRRKRSLYFGPNNQKDDVYSVFKEIGIKIVTNSDVKKPYNCREIYYNRYVVMDDMQLERGLGGVPRPVGGAAVNIKTETIRTYFPETWVWDLVSVGPRGSVTIEKTVPDSITKWAAGAFCTSSVGFGVSPNTGLTAFQPFFVSLTLPYSVIRGEVFTLKATVFNYLSKCIMVKVTLAKSEQYNFNECESCKYTVCLCSEESTTFSWILTPTSLGEVSVKVSAEAMQTDILCGNEVAAIPEKGQIDTVIQKLLVEAEGAPQTVSHNALLCPRDGPVNKTILLKLPEVFVEGSAKASVSVLGDLMGRAMKNIDKLLAMPYGCGEQNMVLFAPNIFILNYLKSTQQLTDQILNKAKRFLESGYQRELTYKHDDGSYSAFGMSDESGNTWLTAFVMKSFGSATPYIFVDPIHIEHAVKWLSSHQMPDGCIASVGKLFHNGMKGGVTDEVSLTAYITAALLELNPNVTNPVVQNCLQCLKTAVSGQIDNMYITALLSYTFTLAGDQEIRSKLLTNLHSKAITDGGTIHWNRPGVDVKTKDSLEVEMTSYVLLALLCGPSSPQFNLDYASGIVRWLVQQQNPYGGFASTQDTVVALQALAKYGAATYSKDGLTTVTVSSAGCLIKKFIVEQSNRLLYQEEQLTEIPGEYTIRAEGQSCVLAQISMHYNIPPPPDFSTFSISSNTTAKCNLTRPELHLCLEVRYQGKRAETNMVIINIKLLSGYIVDKSSIKTLKMGRSVKRVDIDEGFINIYLDELRKDEINVYCVDLEEDVPVKNLKPAVVKVYDYYQISDEAVADYTSPCAERLDLLPKSK
ncbi:alpha-2-macroglobulin isoform X2 [Thalassophryne amazonica]|uniref:alpha-2-macroglobulin isoform X2 n=1 Tax=Thalassophryne amazonica TaxID=390379 RepID=UPI0014716741|nr:alpha-2-macroglobulin isoform X2 [Thalassophryne amazonica]